jgi:uridine kinase
MPGCGSGGPWPAAAADVIGAVAGWRQATPGRPGLPEVFVLAIDGHGGSGKTTIATEVARLTGAALVHTDDFFAESVPAPGIQRPMASYYDWRRLREQALLPLRSRRRASFRRVNWDTGGGPAAVVTVDPAGLIVVEGVFSAAPELADQVDRAVFIDTPEPERLRRVRGRIAPEDWDEDWLRAEQAYFGLIRPPASFDLKVPGAFDGGGVT